MEIHIILFLAITAAYLFFDVIQHHLNEGKSTSPSETTWK